MFTQELIVIHPFIIKYLFILIALPSFKQMNKLLINGGVIEWKILYITTLDMLGHENMVTGFLLWYSTILHYN